MTKQQLQQELLAKIKPGTKPSQLKKSKSLNDLPTTNPPANQPRRSSVNPVINPASLTHQLKKAQDEVSALGLQVEIQGRELTEFKAENEHLKEQAKLKQQTVEGLRKTLESKNTQLVQVQTELDNSLMARHQGLKDFGLEYSKRKQAQNELDNTVEESSEELINSDQTINELRGQVTKLTQTNQNLQRDLGLTSRLAELRKKDPYFEPEFNQGLTYFKYGVYALLAVWFFLTLKNSFLRRKYD